ncbi:hypothetical protein AB0D57_46655 [Streptomyces sp. NPDC048275]|uniref:hypothetical protein n=1 Tax=Streptomyces sp. NPDC048275 TaxID=3155629 RepID=UPI0033F7E78D
MSPAACGTWPGERLAQAFNPQGWQQWLAAALIAPGWILATTIAAGLTRTLARR